MEEALKQGFVKGTLIIPVVVIKDRIVETNQSESGGGAHHGFIRWDNQHFSPAVNLVLTASLLFFFSILIQTEGHVSCGLFQAGSGWTFEKQEREEERERERERGGGGGGGWLGGWEWVEGLCGRMCVPPLLLLLPPSLWTLYTLSESDCNYFFLLSLQTIFCTLLCEDKSICLMSQPFQTKRSWSGRN